MRLEREKNIAAFRGKNWREKWALRNQAQERDPWILRLKMLRVFLVWMPILALSTWLTDQFFSHFQFLATFSFIIIFGLPIDMVFYSLLIVPRIRKALDFPSQPTA